MRQAAERGEPEDDLPGEHTDVRGITERRRASAAARPLDPGVERFLRQLAARGGVGRCYWHLHLWPAEEAGFIRARYVPVQMPRHRTRPIRQWCYEVSLTELGRSIVGPSEGQEANDSHPQEPNADLESRP